MFVHKEVVMAELYFTATNGPGPFPLIGGMFDLCREGKEMVLEFTLSPEELWENYIRPHTRILFEVTFVAWPDEKKAYHRNNNKPAPITLLGRFLPGALTFPEEVLEQLTKRQWKIVFDIRRQHGRVFRLSQPIPDEWAH